MRKPRPIMSVFIVTPEETRLCKRMVFDFPMGWNREMRGMFVQVGHTAIPVSTRQIRAGQIVVSHNQLLNVPTDADARAARFLRKVR